MKTAVLLPVYNPDVEVFKVMDADGSLLGIFYGDYFPRAGKRGGAWMNNICEQYVKDAFCFVICLIHNYLKEGLSQSTTPS